MRDRPMDEDALERLGLGEANRAMLLRILQGQKRCAQHGRLREIGMVIMELSELDHGSSCHKLSSDAKRTEGGCSAGDKQDRRQSGATRANVTDCRLARVIVDDYGCRAGGDSQNVDMALTWNATRKTRRIRSGSKYLICLIFFGCGDRI